MNSLNDYQLVGMLEKLFHLRPGNPPRTTPEEVLDAAQLDGRHAFAFDLGEVRVIRERYSVRAQIVEPKPKSEFIARLDETPGQVCLVSDPNLSGQDALFFCVSGGIGYVMKVEIWLRRQSSPGLVCGSRGDNFYIAAPVKRFTS